MRIKLDAKLDERRFREAAKQTLIRAAEDRARRAGNIRCSVHQKFPKITIGGTADGKIRYDVEGCCQQFRKQVLDRLRRA